MEQEYFCLFWWMSRCLLYNSDDVYKDIDIIGIIGACSNRRAKYQGRRDKSRWIYGSIFIVSRLTRKGRGFTII